MSTPILEFKIKGKSVQVAAIEEAIRAAQFIRNKCLRLWMDSRGISKYDLQSYFQVLAKEFKFALVLNSMARQAAADRAWSAISRFYENCKKQTPGKKGYPDCFVPRSALRVAKHSRSVEYKTLGLSLDEKRKFITFMDKKGIGKLKLIGTYNLNYYQLDQIKRVRLVRRADGSYCQFIIAIDVKIDVEPSKQVIGLDVGLKEFYTDSNGHAEPNPKFYLQSEKQLKRLHKRQSRKCDRDRKKHQQRQFNKYHKARNRLARQYLKISRQRDSVAKPLALAVRSTACAKRIEHAKKVARCVISSNDVVVYEDLKVRNLLKNRCLAKCINNAAWYQFRQWLERFGQKMGKATIAVPPHYTSQECSNSSIKSRECQ